MKKKMMMMSGALGDVMCFWAGTQNTQNLFCFIPSAIKGGREIFCFFFARVGLILETVTNLPPAITPSPQGHNHESE